MSIRKALGATAAMLSVAILPAPGFGQSVADFYKGKEIAILVGAGVGGGYDLYARAIARHWGRHIPGNPVMIVQNMPAGAGVAMLNHLASRAPTDDTVMGSAVAASVVDPVGGDPAILYDSRKLQWIGNISPQLTACFIRTDHPAKTLDDIRDKEVIVAATAADNAGAVVPNIFNTLVGTKFKVVIGYSAAEVTLSVERAETDAACLSITGAFKARLDQDAELQKKLKWFVAMSTSPVAALPGVPPASDYIKTQEGRQILDLLVARVAIGRPFVMPPGVPADRVEAVRKAFFATLKDPEFLAEAAKAKLEIDPIDHVMMEKMINDAYATPPNVIKAAYDMMRGAETASTKKQ